MRKSYLELGKIVGTHGVRGEMKLDPWTDSPDVFDGLDTVYLDSHGVKSVPLHSARPHKRQELITLDGVNDMDAAEKMRGTVLYIKREDMALEEGSYLIAEVIGCTVQDADTDAVYGTVTDVTNTGANDIWTVKTANGRVLMPIIPGLLVSVDIDKELALVRPIRGIFDDAVVVKGE